MRIRLLLSMTGLVLAVQACGSSEAGPESGQTISKEAFTQAYIALRMEALRTSRQGEINLPARDSILDSMGLEPQDLIDFVEVWGEDGEMMSGVWEVADSVIRAERVAASDDDYEEGDMTGVDSSDREGPGGSGGAP